MKVEGHQVYLQYVQQGHDAKISKQVKKQWKMLPVSVHGIVTFVLNFMELLAHTSYVMLVEMDRVTTCKWCKKQNSGNQSKFVISICLCKKILTKFRWVTLTRGIK